MPTATLSTRNTDMTKLVVSSLESVISLLKGNKGLLTLPALQSLRPLISAPIKQGCCGGKVDTAKYRGALETALRNILPDQAKKMKDILKVERICYFAKVGGKIEQKCF